MYEREFKTYEVLPVTKKHKVKAYVDTADTGEDFLCCIVYVETEIGNFILDVYYRRFSAVNAVSYGGFKLLVYLLAYLFASCVVRLNWVVDDYRAAELVPFGSNGGYLVGDCSRTRCRRA